MALRVICSGYLFRYPLGGMTWHHAQYLLGLRRLGCDVTYLEVFGWENSCYDPRENTMTGDPQYGIDYMRDFWAAVGDQPRWCYLAENGTAHGMSRAELAAHCEASDLFLNLSHINWAPELDLCRRRVSIDTDPVFTQIGAHGMGGPWSNYHALFTYGENMNRAGCTVPNAGQTWLPTRQPVVLDAWPVTPGDANAPLTTVMNWTVYDEQNFEGKSYGQKDREFTPFFSLPMQTGETMEIALNAPVEIRTQLQAGGWRLSDPRQVTKTPFSYQTYMQRSRGEFSVAKHGYVSTRSGWFSDRSTGYLASGRPVIVQDTGFSDIFPTGEGLLAFQTPADVARQIDAMRSDYARHCTAARAIAAEYFDARKVLTDLLSRCW